MSASEEAIFLLFVALSGASVGTTIVAAGLRVRLLFATRRLRHLWHIFLGMGYALTVGTVLWRVLPRGEIQLAPRVWIYLAGLTLAGLGALGVSADAIREDVERAERGGKK